MPRPKSKPAAADTPTPAVPIAMDLHRISDAMRALMEITVQEDRRVGVLGNVRPPDWPVDNEIGRAIYNPIGTACRTSFLNLLKHLSALVGDHAATELGQRIITESLQKIAPEFAAQPTEPMRH